MRRFTVTLVGGWVTETAAPDDESFHLSRMRPSGRNLAFLLVEDSEKNSCGILSGNIKLYALGNRGIN